MRRRLFRIEEAETGRVEAFSDGVLAIVITLLALDIKVPQNAVGDAALWRGIVERLPMIGAWLVSFFFVLVFWVAHHTLFSQLAKTDRGLLWLNGLFLLAISFSPFPTALVGEYPGAAPALFLLSLVMFLAASFFASMRWYATLKGRLARPEVPRHYFQRAFRRGLIAPFLYAVAMGLSFVAPWAAVSVQALVPLLFVFPTQTPGAATVGSRL
jgi:uncharacterized membrane protein